MNLLLRGFQHILIKSGKLAMKTIFLHQLHPYSLLIVDSVVTDTHILVEENAIEEEDAQPIPGNRPSKSPASTGSEQRTTAHTKKLSATVVQISVINTPLTPFTI